MSFCETCAGKCQPRCPFQKATIPTEIQEYGCALYVHQPKPYNVAGIKTKCRECRYLFRKKKSEMGDRSFIVCGAIPSQAKRTQPVPCCPNYKPLRRKQMQKRLARANKVYPAGQNMQGPPLQQYQRPPMDRQPRQDAPMMPSDNWLKGSIYQSDPQYNNGRDSGGYQRRQNGYNDRGQNGYNNGRPPYPPRRGNNGYNS